MSLTCREEIGRVRRVGQGCYEDTREDIRNKSYVEFGERYDTRTNWQHYIAADCRPTN